jgi:Protein of unknown function (DUF1559)
MKQANLLLKPSLQTLLTFILLIGIARGENSEVSALPGDNRTSAKVDLPTDLDLVPRDAAAFLHARLVDLWQSAWAKDLRFFVDKAGPDAWKAFEKKCPLDPASLDQITLILLTPQTMVEPFPTVDPEAMSAMVVVTTKKPYSRLQLIRALGPREKVYRQKLYYFNQELWSGLILVDDHTFIIGSEDALIRFFQMSRSQNRTGPLQAALVEAAGKHQVVAGINPTLLGKEKGTQFMPPPLLKLLTAYCGFLTLDIDQGLRLNLHLDFPGQDGAREGEKALRDTLDLARQGLSQSKIFLEGVLSNKDKNSVGDLAENFSALVALGVLGDLDELLEKAPIRRQDSAVKLAMSYGRFGVSESPGLLLASTFGITALGTSAHMTFGRVAGAIGSGEKKDPIEEHLENLAQAMDKYHEEKRSYPSSAIYDREGRPILSWRVALLPYLKEDSLYREFNLDEPWDSLQNKRLLKRLPKALQTPDYERWGTGRFKASTLVFTGEGTIFEGKKGLRKADARKQAILLAHLPNDAGVYWTKPSDLAYAADKPLPQLFGRYGGRLQVMLVDGTFRNIDQGTDEKALRDLIEQSSPKATKQANATPLSQLEAYWSDFGQNDDEGTKKAWQDVSAMIQTPGNSVPFLKDRLRPVPRLDQKQIDQWLVDLDSRDFQIRDLAAKNLGKAGDLAFPALEKKFEDKTVSLEARRRLESLMEKIKTVLSGEELRAIRGIEVLEGIGTPDAKEVLDALAHGCDGAVITEQAKNAQARLGRQSPRK